MKRFQLGAKLQYRVYQPATFLFNVAVMENAHQKILAEDIGISPESRLEEYALDPGRSRYHRLNVPATESFAIEYRAEIESRPHWAADNDIPEVPQAQLPLETMPFVFPSRYCESDRLSRLTIMQFGDLQPGYSRVQAICNWIYDNVFYLSGSTSSMTSAFNTVTERAGVCRDFAHLGIAFCRGLGIPARFVTGYVIGLNPPDFHAAFEAYLGERWYLFDATRMVSLQNFIRVGTGYDAAGVAFATIFGAVEMSHMELFVEDTGGPGRQDDLHPISIAAGQSCGPGE